MRQNACFHQHLSVWKQLLETELELHIMPSLDHCLYHCLFILSVVDFTSLPFILMFVEYLHLQGLKYPTMLNYVSVLSHYFAYYSLPVEISIIKR